MRKIVIKIFVWLRSPSSYTEICLGPDLRSKIEVIHATSAVLFYIFHTIAFVIKNMVESHGVWRIK